MFKTFSVMALKAVIQLYKEKHEQVLQSRNWFKD
jgi:hypothetical protein